MISGYFYTLSAIAQSFAALIALTAVFVIYKLQFHRNQRDNLIGEMRSLIIQQRLGGRSPITGSKEIIAWNVSKMTKKEVLDLARGITGGESDLYQKFIEVLKEFDNNMHLKEKIIKTFKYSSKANCYTVILSLILLPWGKFFSFLTQASILVLLILFSIFSIFITFKSITTLLD